MKNHLSPLVSPKASFTLSLIFFSLRIVRNLRVVNNTEKYITIKHVVVFSVIRRQSYEKLNANLNKSKSNIWIRYNSWTKYTQGTYKFDGITL